MDDHSCNYVNNNILYFYIKTTDWVLSDKTH